MADTESVLSGQTLHRSTSQGELLAAVPTGDARYEVIGILGEGGMGRVIEAVDKQFSRVVAIKELHGSGGDAARLMTEAQVTGNLEHPGVPPVYERGLRADGSPFYVMRRVRGRALEDALSEAKDLDGRMLLLPALTRAAQTLAFAHERGVVHRDIKPQNIMVGSHGEVFVVDWGLARVGHLTSSGTGSSDGQASQSGQKTLAGAVMGTPAYMAPEQARGDVSLIDARTDVFALGAVLYRLLSGRPPYDSTSTAQAVERASRGEHPDIDDVAADAPAPLREICKKAMAVAPGQRFSTAQHLADALEHFASHAVSKAYEATAGWGSTFAIVFGLGATLFGLTGLVRFGSDVLWGPHLLFSPTFFSVSMGMAWLERRSQGRLGLAPLGYSMAAATMVTGFIAVGFSILNKTGDWDFVARQAGVALAMAGLLSALALGTWGIVFRTKR